MAVSFAVIILIVIGGLGLASTIQPAAKSGTGPGSTSSANSTSIDGLRLTVSSNASDLVVGQPLNVSLSIVNTLPTVNNVKPSNDWLMHAVPVALWPPCYFGLPAEAAVLQGNYDSQDIRRAANVTFSYMCMEGVNVDHVIFQPNSDQVNLMGLYDVTGTNETLGPFHMSLNFTTGGYWNLQNLSSELNIPILGEQYPPRPPAYTPFTPGEYTIAVADEWGQVAILHVTVVSVSSLQLQAEVTPMVAYEGQNVSISTELYNQYSGGVSLNASEILNPSEAPCGLGIRPIGVSVYFGDFSAGNISSALPLTFYDASVPPSCSIRYSSEYTFQAESDSATVTYLSTSTRMTANYTDMLSGSWYSCYQAAGPCGGYQFANFEPGTYTVLVFDPWGQQVIRHFTVLPAYGPASEFLCPIPYTGTDSPSSNSSEIQAFPIISAAKSHSAVICVTYYDNNPDKNSTVSVTPSLEIGTIESAPYAGCSPSPCTSYSFVDSGDFRITTNVSTFLLGATHATKVTVAYLITPKSDTPGFYWMNVGMLAPYDCAVEFPFAYGYSFSGANSSGQYFPLPKNYFGGCITYNSSFYSEYAYAFVTAVSNGTSVIPLNCGAYSCDVEQT